MQGNNTASFLFEGEDRNSYDYIFVLITPEFQAIDAVAIAGGADGEEGVPAPAAADGAAAAAAPPPKRRRAPASARGRGYMRLRPVHVGDGAPAAAVTRCP
eukprot:gene46019-64538_t